MRKHLLAAAFLAAASATLVSAQTTAPVPSSPAGEISAEPIAPMSQATPLVVPAPLECCVLAKLTPVFLTIGEPLDSDKSKIGHRFALTLRHPLEIAGGVVIPAGTPGIGEVVHAAKSRAMGKAGELVLAARYLDYQGTRIPLRSLRYGKGQGKDNVDTAVIIGFAVSALITPFITGGEVRIPAGTDVWAKTATDVPFPRAAPAPQNLPTQGVE